MRKLAEFIHAELQSGKTIAQIKRDISTTRGGWSSKEISKAIKVAVENELKQRRQPQERSETEESADANKMWLAAIVAALVAVIVVTAVVFYLLR
jgi:anti-sigma-K factor RskA